MKIDDMSELPRFDMAELLKSFSPPNLDRPSVCVLLFPSLDFDLLLAVRFRQQEDGSIIFDPNVKEIVFDEEF